MSGDLGIRPSKHQRRRQDPDKRRDPDLAVVQIHSLEALALQSAEGFSAYLYLTKIRKRDSRHAHRTSKHISANKASSANKPNNTKGHSNEPTPPLNARARLRALSTRARIPTMIPFATKIT
jgi:hypothetical protein